ncbi:ankyrin repeat [Fusarium sp. NRRL 25303]|nr:ankyrin repeat [Fusarium sp. NRRL 25303]
MTSVGDVIAIVEATAKTVNYSRNVRNAEKERQQLRDELRILAKTLQGFTNVCADLTGNNKELFEEINSRIESRMTDLQERLDPEEKGVKRQVKRFLWPLKKEGLKEAINAIEKLNDRLRTVFQTHEIEEGSGKTGMAEYIGNKLREEAGSPPEYHVGRVFCDHQTLAGLEDYMDIIMSLWAQLVDSIGGLRITPKELKDWTLIIETGQLLSREDEVNFKIDVMSRTISQAGRTILILDGLDEVQPSLQKDLVDTLRKILKANNQCRLMILSRPYGTISAMFIEDPKLELEAAPHDIDLYIRDRISRSNGHFLSRHDTTEDIISQLCKKCDGTILMAKLHMDEILKAVNEYECWETIHCLPTKASEAYETGLKRLAEAYRESPDGLPCYAIQALFWVAVTKAPMEAKQLRQALAMDLKDEKYHVNREVIQDIDMLCGEMLIVDPVSQEVQVAHKTIADSLLQPETQARWFPNVNQHIRRTLIRYLSLNDLNKPLHDSKSIGQFRERHPLLPYALMYWGDDLSKSLGNLPSNSTLWEETKKFLTSSHEAWNSQVLEQVAEMIDKRSRRRLGGYPTPEKVVIPGRIGGLHWAVIFSLKEFIGILYKHERQSPIQAGMSLSPLGLAAAHSRADIAQDLLDAGASADGEDYNGYQKRPPLYDAMLFGHEPIVSLLLERGARVSLQRTDNDQSPLDLLHETGLEPLVPTIVKAISKRPLMSFQEYLLLVRGAFTKELRMAIEMGLDINQPCGNGKNALDYAFELGNNQIISILEDHGAVPRLQWKGWRSDSSGYLHNCPEPYLPGTRVVNERFWGEDNPDQVLSSGDSPPTYDCDVSSDPGRGLSHRHTAGGIDSAPPKGSPKSQSEEEEDIDEFGAGGMDRQSSEHRSSSYEQSVDNSLSDYRHLLFEFGAENSHLLMEVTVDETVQLPVRAIVFETVSRDQGWSDHNFKHTYLSSTRSWFDMRVCHGNQQSQVFRIQHNVHADKVFRMHTNIWDLEELAAVSPLRAELIKGLRHGSKLQIFSHAAWGGGWRNIVSMLRVSVYGQV